MSILSEQLKHDPAISRLLFSHLPVFLLMLDQENKIISINKPMLTATDYSESDVRGHLFFNQFIPPEEHHQFSQQWHTSLDNQQDFFKESSISTKSGTRIPVLWHAIKLPASSQILSIGIDLSEIKEIHKKIRRNETLLKVAIEQMPIPVIMADAPNARITALSQVAKDFMVKEAEDISAVPLGERRDYWPTFYPDGVALQDQDLPLYKAITKGIPTKNQEYIIRRGGVDHWVSASATPVYDEEGNITAGIIAFPEITEQKKAFQILATNDERHRQLLHAARAMSIMLSAKGNILSFDKLAEDLTGYKAREVMGQHFATIFLQEENRATFQQHLSNVLQKTPLQNFEVILHIKGNFKRHVVINAIFHELSPETSSILIACQDITALRLAEKSRKETETSLRELFNTIDSGVIMLIPENDGKSFIIKDLNSAGERLTHTRKDNIIGQKLLSVFPELKKIGLFQAFQEVNRTGKFSYIPNCWYKSATIDLWFDSYIYKLSSGDIVSIFSDLTEQKKVEGEKEKLADQLRQSRKMQAIGQLAGGVAHDFNNLLAGILGCAEIVLSEESLTTHGKQHMKNIIKTTEKGQDLTRNLMSFARMKDKIAVETNLNEIINHVISILEHTVDRKVVLKTSLQAEHVTIMGDPTDLENSILNIALNARDAMPEGGTINFESDNVVLDQKFCAGKEKLSPGDYLLLKISDTGNGMPEHIKDKIFDPFFTTKPEGEGTGLGLSSVFGCIQAHNGYIAVDSVWHQGTTFIIYLPISLTSKAQTAPQTANTPEVKTGQGHIILVEDEDIVREVTSIAIKKLGYQVTAFENGFEAIDFYREHVSSIDLVILDMVMPKINGLALFKKLKAINKDLKAIIMSGYTGQHTPEQALEAGIITLLQKPVKASRLSQVLSEILTKKDGD